MSSFPFTSVVGQQQAKLALQLVAVDPSIGGVLLRGEKGSAKTTLARGLAALMGDAPFIELPLGATEDRLLGSIDVAAALGGGQVSFRPGLLADAHGGVLYVDEVNLLADHLTDMLLDAAASGVNRVERDGVAHHHDARFVLVGSMNPEEGELRPQLADRFGLCVEVRAPLEPATRAEIVRRRLAFDQEQGGEPGATDASGMRSGGMRSGGMRSGGMRSGGMRSGGMRSGGMRSGGMRSGGMRSGGIRSGADIGRSGDRELADRLLRTSSAEIPDELVAQASAIALSAGVEGLRADLVLCRAAAAHAALAGHSAADIEDLRAVAPLALMHRVRRSPSDPPVAGGEHLRQVIDEALGESDDIIDIGEHGEDGSEDNGSANEGTSGGPEARQNEGTSGGPAARQEASDPSAGEAHAGGAKQPMPLGRRLAVSLPPRDGDAESAGGRVVRDVPLGEHPDGPVSVTATVRRVVADGRVDASGGRPQPIRTGDLRVAKRHRPKGSLVVFAVDTSGSMGAVQRAQAATGAVLGLLADAYLRRDQVSMVAFGAGGSQVVLSPTGSIEVARRRLQSLRTGGTTPLGAGLRQALAVATSTGNRRDNPREPLIVLLSDGRATAATGDGEPVAEALEAAAAIAAKRVRSIVVDCETGAPRLGLAREVARVMGARYIAGNELTPEMLNETVRCSYGL